MKRYLFNLLSHFSRNFQQREDLIAAIFIDKLQKKITAPLATVTQFVHISAIANSFM
jgi:hypothetical protein